MITVITIIIISLIVVFNEWLCDSSNDNDNNDNDDDKNDNYDLKNTNDFQLS